MINVNLFQNIKKDDKYNIICVPSDAISVFNYVVKKCGQTNQFEFLSEQKDNGKTPMYEKIQTFTQISNNTDCGYKNLDKKDQDTQKRILTSSLSILIKTAYAPEDIVQLIIDVNNDIQIKTEQYKERILKTKERI